MKNDDIDRIPSRAELWREVLEEDNQKNEQLREMTYQLGQLSLWFDAKLSERFKKR